MVQWVKLVCLVLVCASLSTEANVLQLAEMIDCATKQTWLDYSAYGCYCGLGGEGTALDDIDRCCEAHDNCYGQISETKDCKKPELEVYFDDYKVTRCTHCVPSQNKCHLDICKCDSTIANCLKGKKLNSDYIGYNKSKCKPKT